MNQHLLSRYNNFFQKFKGQVKDKIESVTKQIHNQEIKPSILFLIINQLALT